MDYTKLPRQLIYRTRKSLEEFTTNNEMNEYLVDNMVEIYYLQSSDFKERATACFNAAYYICTLIGGDEHPEWSLPKYYDIALCGQKDSIVEQAISLSLVKIYLLHFSSDWNNKHKKLFDKLDDFLDSHWIQAGDPFMNDYSYKDAYMQLNSFDVATSPFSPTEFALRTIDQEAIEEMQIAHFTWTQFTDYYKYNIMQDIVFHVGKSEDEMTILVNSLRYDAERFYTHDNPYYESVCNRLTKIEKDIHIHYHALENQTLLDAPNEELQHQGDVRPLQARIAELEAELEKTNSMRVMTAEDAQDMMKEILGSDNKSDDSADDVTKSVVDFTSDNSLHQQLADAKKTIEEQEATIKELNETILRYQMRGWPPTKRKGIALGLTPIQADIFGDFLANRLGIAFSNKKEELSLILNCLFGQGRSSLANKMSKVNSQGTADDRLYVASIFGPFSPKIAREICSDWDENLHAPWEEDEENEEITD